MFTRQAPNIAESLFLAGLPQASVSAAQNFLGQCRASIEHRGPVRFDYTNPNFRLITPSIAIINIHGNGPPPEDFPRNDPGPEGDENGEDPLNPRRPQDPNPPEHDPHQPPPPPGPGEGGAGPPGKDGIGREYRAGPYIGITNRFRSIYLRRDEQRRHTVWPAGRNAADVLGSVSYKSEARDEEFKLIPIGAPSSFIELEIQDRAEETLWRLHVKYLRQISIVTAVQYDEESGQIVISKKNAWVFKPEDDDATFIETTEVEYLTDAVLGAGSLDFDKHSARVLKPQSVVGTVSIPLAECPAP